ncbi:Hpt domain-containing protein [Pseudomonas aeruginosa]|uniref:Hpt domain-containing protein n=1 Tax=Pseudomonas aeruginosa TaxID=287 RepID=UPI000F82B1E3|nr:Hpt domain-containing protein [Pseudomonas aeruginosa]MCR6949091.1 Hpt domain-containing protein [Pseudomonas aeruginosa]MCR7075607.1 Hpt domain-containing protein [Pseudomonas aeruginosa]MCR7164029.1 Hpt domain-containing protein [Pseudomonas aeruginosa]MCR7292996.1 Hpt domain-containing protein [Pseudomonas aeruginosa]MCR7299159.1 Hpt domain-containing protein [Pseudomonas aeruginosa]
MGDRHDYVALEWVKGEIAETLKQARQALEAFVENPQDPTRMRFCLTYVHQVQGTLQMVEFYGAALLAEEMEQLVQALLDGRVPNQGEALEVLMQAILQLPVYLDRIQTARRDLPMVVLPLLNDLRAARGEKLLSETSLFAPDLSQRQPQLDGEAIAQLRTDELGGLLRKLRQTQQMALVGLLRNQDVATSLGYLARVYARLEGLCREAPLGPLWSIASGLVEGLANGSVVNSASVRTLLRQLDRELKRLVEQGADGLNQAAPDELVKNLLFYVAKAPSQSPRIRALKEQYRLDEALPDHETVDAERARLAGPDRDAMRSVVGALCEELVRIKDSLDLFVRSDRGHPSELDALLAPLKQIADTLAVLGFGQPRKVILDQLDVIHALAQGRREPSDAILMDVAGALLYVEATLAGMAGPGDERNSEESRLPTTDVAQIHQLVIKEARNGLEQAKDAIIEFIASQWNHEHLARVPELLTQVRGGLAMIPLERAATLLETCNRYIQEQLLARKAVPDWQSLDTLADAITSVEYYLERLSEDHASQSDLILDVAEDSLANLGYTLKPNSSAPAEPGLSGPAAIESPAAEPERPEAVVEVAETAEQPPADTAPAEAAREDAPQLASDDNWTLGEVAPDAGEPSLDLALDLPLDDSAEVPPALPEVVEESGQPQSTPAPARSLDDFSLDEIDLSGLDLPADAAPASGPAALADWSLPEQWGLGDDLAQPAQAGETLDLSLEEPALSFDAPLESLEPLPALEPFDGSAEQELVLDALDPLPLDVALPEAEGEVSAWEGSSLEELDLSDLDLPEVQLPEAEAEAPPAAEALASEAPALSLAEVMAAPVQPINPPAQNVPVSLLPPPADEEPVDEELREVFIEEAGEVLETIGRYLPAWKADHDDREALTEVRRAFHTLKGSGRMVRALVIGELAWSIENLFNRVLDRSIAVSEPVQRVVDQVVALLPELVEEFAANAQRQRDDVDLLAATAHALAKGEPLPEPPAPDDGGVPPEAGAEQPSSLDNGVQAPPLADAPQAAAEAQSDVELLDPQLLEIFTNEAETHLEALVGFLADCARELPQPVTDALQRALHTLKGSAHMAGILPIAEIATPLEKLVKEYKSNLLAFDLREAELLHDAEQLFRIGLEQVGAQRPLNPIPGSDALLERIEALHQERIASLEAERYSDAGERRDPLLIEAFLVEGMDILLDAEDLLERWHEHPQERQELSALREELSTLDRGARHAELPQVEELCQALLALYEAVEEGRLAVSPAFFEEARQAHEALIGMMDQVAAGLQVTPRPERVAALQELLEAPAAEAVPFIDPESLGADDFPPEDEEPALPEAVFEEAGTPAEETVPAAPAPAPGRELDEEMVSIFLEEAVDILESAGQALAQWQAEPGALSSLSALQRDLHTLKGGARMAEIGEIGDLAHELEFLYEGLCGGRLRASPALFGLLQRCHDELAEMLEAVRGHRTLPDGQALIAEIRRLRSDPDEQLSVPTSVSLKPLAAKGAAADESEILDIFLEEADDLLENLELALGRWDGGNGDAQPLDDLLRILHTLKGGARLAGQTELGNLAHDLEQHLTDAQQQGAPWPDSLLLDAQSGLEGLQRQVDLLRERLAEDDEAGERPEPAQALVQADDTDRAVASALAELTRLAPAAGAIMAAEAAPPAAPATTLPFVRKAQEAAQEAASRRAPQELVKVPAELLENLVNLAGETSIFRGRVEQQVSDVGFTLGEMESTIERVRDQLRRLDTETQAQILSRHQADAERAGYEEFDPLEMDRYSQLQQLSRALFESASDLLDLKETLAAKNRDAETLLLQQARVNTELQEGLMRTRMVPFDRLVPRLRRIVRQVAGELGKQVEFVVGNADGEMDRTVLERIVAPLEHMLRNAVDHGIESGETRRAAGKPEHGTIRLNIGREGGDILLTLSDDGAGIRLDAVRRKAIERGLMSADSDLSDHEVLQFVLESGFSTAEKVTQISGRGVGLDVANSEVKQLGGSVSIQTEPGQGTRFNVRLPFTVSVNRALMVLSGEDLYAVPLNTIEGIVRVSPYELEALYDQRGEAGLDTPSFEYAGQSYELKYLGELLNNGQEPKLVGQSLPLPVILVRSSEHAVAVQVDSLAGSREIVVKSLGPQFAGVAGISGATLLGDGRVVVILDLLATIRSRHALLGQESRRERLALRQEMAASESEQQRPPLVMVVDDSVTVRKVTTRLLERNGMNVLTAKDGVDAIAQLQEHRPDILLLDIEMPRMDGFEVATLVRHDERLGNLPIIMITSRTGEKHRERALGIGVNQYLGKPYQETELLEAIQSLVGQHE